MNIKKIIISVVSTLLVLLIGYIIYLNVVDIEPLIRPQQDLRIELSQQESNFYLKHVKEDSFCRKNNLSKIDLQVLVQLSQFSEFKMPVQKDKNFYFEPGFICFTRQIVWKAYFEYLEQLLKTDKEYAIKLVHQYLSLMIHMVQSDLLIVDRVSEIQTLKTQFEWLLNSPFKANIDPNILLPLQKINYLDLITQAIESEKQIQNRLVINQNEDQQRLFVNSANGLTWHNQSVFFQKNRTHQLIEEHWNYQLNYFRNCVTTYKNLDSIQLQKKCLNEFKKFDLPLIKKYAFNYKGHRAVIESKQIQLQQLLLRYYVELSSINSIFKKFN